MLKLKTENCRIAAVYDMRYETPVDITDGSGNFGKPVYTLKSQDITKEKKPELHRITIIPSPIRKRKTEYC